MTKIQKARVRLAVESRYSRFASEGYRGGCCGIPDDRLPALAREVSLGCGSPLRFARLEGDMTVLDLGCGGGIDAFAAAEKLGESGRVIGIDSTSKMVTRARRAALANHYTNVEFRTGDMESLPVPSNVGDLIISNCAVNLATNKRRVYAEMHRVLKKGGRLIISDIVSDVPIPSRVRGNADKWSRCIAGALTARGLRRLLSITGFTDFEVLEKKVWNKGKEDGLSLSSMTFTATKPYPILPRYHKLRGKTCFAWTSLPREKG